MATNPQTIEFLLEQLSSLQSVRARKMFGEYGLYAREVLANRTPVQKTTIVLTKMTGTIANT